MVRAVILELPVQVEQITQVRAQVGRVDQLRGLGWIKYKQMEIKSRINVRVAML